MIINVSIVYFSSFPVTFKYTCHLQVQKQEFSVAGSTPAMGYVAQQRLTLSSTALVIQITALCCITLSITFNFNYVPYTLMFIMVECARLIKETVEVKTGKVSFSTFRMFVIYKIAPFSDKIVPLVLSCSQQRVW